MSFEQKLRELGLDLPSPPKPVATYVPAVQAGELLFVSGVLPLRDGKLVLEGKLGRDLTEAQGYEAARIALLNALAIIRQELGSLDRVKKVVRLTGFVASADSFVQHPAVLNGASELLVRVFGQAGQHARVTVGTAALPLNAPVEIDLIVQVTLPTEIDTKTNPRV
jgi:enamine deaminase RidA (YjgF/YER057c/UK114 family)